MSNSNERILKVLKKYTHNVEVREIKKELIKKLHGCELCDKGTLEEKINNFITKSVLTRNIWTYRVISHLLIN